MNTINTAGQAARGRLRRSCRARLFGPVVRSDGRITSRRVAARRRPEKNVAAAKRSGPTDRPSGRPTAAGRCVHLAARKSARARAGPITKVTKKVAARRWQGRIAGVVPHVYNDGARRSRRERNAVQLQPVVLRRYSRRRCPGSLSAVRVSNDLSGI